MSVIYGTRVIDGVSYDYVYSDEGRYVVRDGRSYESVYNPLNSGRTYEEGDVIPDTEPTPEELLEILLGGSDDND